MMFPHSTHFGLRPRAFYLLRRPALTRMRRLARIGDLALLLGYLLNVQGLAHRLTLIVLPEHHHPYRSNWRPYVENSPSKKKATPRFDLPFSKSDAAPPKRDHFAEPPWLRPEFDAQFLGEFLRSHHHQVAQILARYPPRPENVTICVHKRHEWFEPLALLAFQALWQTVLSPYLMLQRGVHSLADVQITRSILL